MSDADVDDNTFESTDAGASEVCHPCKVAEVSTSKTGKHGHAKALPTATPKSGKSLEKNDRCGICQKPFAQVFSSTMVSPDQRRQLG